MSDQQYNSDDQDNMKSDEGSTSNSETDDEIEECNEAQKYSDEAANILGGDNSSAKDDKEICNCKKTKCLKLYCQCFAAQIYCEASCKCLSCENLPGYDNEREDAVRLILERNPNAFDSKFKAIDVASAEEKTYDSEVGADGALSLTHKIGCRCRKSMCLKKYCECYQASVPCSLICSCLNCLNTGAGAGAMTIERSKQSDENADTDNHMMKSSAPHDRIIRKSSDPIVSIVKNLKESDKRSSKPLESISDMNQLYTSPLELSSIRKTSKKSSNNNNHHNSENIDKPIAMNHLCNSSQRNSKSRNPAKRKLRGDDENCNNLSNISDSTSSPDDNESISSTESKLKCMKVEVGPQKSNFEFGLVGDPFAIEDYSMDAELYNLNMVPSAILSSGKKNKIMRHSDIISSPNFLSLSHNHNSPRGSDSNSANFNQNASNIIVNSKSIGSAIISSSVFFPSILSDLPTATDGSSPLSSSTYRSLCELLLTASPRGDSSIGVGAALGLSPRAGGGYSPRGFGFSPRGFGFSPRGLEMQFGGGGFGQLSSSSSSSLSSPRVFESSSESSSDNSSSSSSFFTNSDSAKKSAKKKVVDNIYATKSNLTSSIQEGKNGNNLWDTNNSNSMDIDSLMGGGMTMTSGGSLTKYDGSSSDSNSSTSMQYQYLRQDASAALATTTVPFRVRGISVSSADDSISTTTSGEYSSDANTDDKRGSHHHRGPCNDNDNINDGMDGMDGVDGMDSLDRDTVAPGTGAVRRHHLVIDSGRPVRLI